jgi:type II secretory pathway pseudopilin PulG
MKKTSAFSLMEMSLVVVIVSLLIVGVIQTSYMVKQAKLSSARLLTQNSPVNKIRDLILWYETSLETSFDISSQLDGTAISSWYDNNPEAVTKNNATQLTSSNQPIFYDNVFNLGIPGIRFDGSNDCMTFDGSLLIKSSYTVFAVEQKRAAVTSGFAPFIGGTTNASAQNLFFGYGDDTTARLTHFNYTLNYASSADLAYSSPKTRIHSGRFSTSGGMGYWLNGVSKASNATVTTTLTAYSGSALGRRTGSSTTYFKGDIAEIIIFKRALTTEERRLIEIYLGKKYSITIS